jgi:hypothetical protein
VNDELYWDSLRAALKGGNKRRIKVPTERTPLAPNAPAPRLNGMIAKHGAEPTEMALSAWEARVRGEPIINVAHSLGLSIEGAKKLIREAHDAIAEDLKTNLDLNRQLDLDRIDRLIGAYYPSAKAGEHDSANVVLRCLQQRSKLTGIEPQPDPGRSNPQSVLVWVQNQLPSINRIVDALPLELPPSAPS